MTRPVALALGGGAALGWAHLGVLRVLRAEGIAIGAVAGTSIGALTALCLAGDRLDVLEEVALGATRARVRAYLDPRLGRGALLGGRRIARELAENFGAARLEDLPLPIAIVAADLDAGTEVRLTGGPAVAAVQASMALPGLFPPVTIGARTMIDGGMVACVPIGAARALAPGLPVVAVDLMSDYAGHVAAGAGRARTVAGTLRAAFLMMMAQQTRAALALDPPEVRIALPVGHIGTTAFTRARDLMAIGQEAARAALPAIRAAQKSGS